MKRGNELIKKNNAPKVFVYCDKNFDLTTDNVFISGVYSGLKEFRKDNPDYRPLISYDAEHLLEVLNKQAKALKKKTPK